MNVKNITTKNLKAILDDPYCRGIDGKDYQDHESELRAEYSRRLEKQIEQQIKDRTNEPGE